MKTRQHHFTNDKLNIETDKHNPLDCMDRVTISVMLVGSKQKGIRCIKPVNKREGFYCRCCLVEPWHKTLQNPARSLIATTLILNKLGRVGTVIAAGCVFNG